MPYFAHLAATVLCPQCFGKLTSDGQVGFQWGYCSTTLGGVGSSYKVGDAIAWRVDQHGQVPKWSYFRNSGGNIGDPLITDLLVRESEYYLTACRKCGFKYAGIGITIRGGVICEVGSFATGLPSCDISVIESDGRLIAHSEWDDFYMFADVYGGWFEEMVIHPESAKRRL